MKRQVWSGHHHGDIDDKIAKDINDGGGGGTGDLDDSHSSDISNGVRMEISW
jgi:hypothetical protein